MNTKTIQTINNDEIEISKRRDFLKKLAYGSLLALGGTDVASAAIRTIIQPHEYGRGRAYHHHPQPIHSRLQHSLSNRKPKRATNTLISHKTLHFEHTQTGDKLKLTYFENGHYLKDALNEINHLLRDYHTNEVHAIDTALLDQLFDLKQTLGTNKPLHIVSAYRAPITNAILRRNTSGVAEHSLHMQGKAIDIRIEGLQAHTIKNAALSLAKGGVGYYPESNFVHLDSGDVRTW